MPFHVMDTRSNLLDWVQRPRYTDLRTNLNHFAKLYDAALAKTGKAVLRHRKKQSKKLNFLERYWMYLKRSRAEVDQLLSRLQ